MPIKRVLPPRNTCQSNFLRARSQTNASSLFGKCRLLEKKISWNKFSTMTKIFKRGREATCAVFIDHRQLLPFEERHHVQDGPGDGGVLRVEVDEERVLVVHGRVLPAGLNVRDLQGVADGLDGADRRAVGGPEHCDHAESQLVTHCGRGNRSCARIQTGTH